jgi:hypothetical protein
VSGVKGSTIAVLAMLAGLFLGVPASRAGVKHVAGQVTIRNYKFDGINHVEVFGRVTSRKHKCEGHRRISLRQVTDDVAAGSGLTRKGGHWEVFFRASEVPFGNLQATVAAKRSHAHGETLICKGDASPVFRV